MTRPLLRASISCIRAYPWRGLSAKLIRINRTGSVRGLVSASTDCIATCRIPPYYVCSKVLSSPRLAGLLQDSHLSCQLLPDGKKGGVVEPVRLLAWVQGEVEQ